MTNRVLAHGDAITMAVPNVAAPNDIKSGDPLVFGRGTCPSFGLAGVAATSYNPPSGDPTGNIGVLFDGVFLLSVRGADAPTGGNNIAINPGDRVFADGGTYDSATGCLYGFALTADASAGVYFGNALDAVGAGQTKTIRVRLKKSGA